MFKILTLKVFQIDLKIWSVMSLVYNNYCCRNFCFFSPNPGLPKSFFLSNSFLQRGVGKFFLMSSSLVDSHQIYIMDIFLSDSNSPAFPNFRIGALPGQRTFSLEIFAVSFSIIEASSVKSCMKSEKQRQHHADRVSWYSVSPLVDLHLIFLLIFYFVWKITRGNGLENLRWF